MATKLPARVASLGEIDGKPSLWLESMKHAEQQAGDPPPSVLFSILPTEGGRGVGRRMIFDSPPPLAGRLDE